MPKKLLPSLLLATVCGLFAACSQHTGAPVVATATTPEKAVRNFYNWRVRTQLTGLPSDQQLEELKPYISVELHDLLADTAARAKRQSSRKSKADPSSTEMCSPACPKDRRLSCRATSKTVRTVSIWSRYSSCPHSTCPQCTGWTMRSSFAKTIDTSLPIFNTRIIGASATNRRWSVR